MKKSYNYVFSFLVLSTIIISQIGLSQDTVDDISFPGKDNGFSSDEGVFVLVPMNDDNGDSSIFLPSNVSAIAFYDDERFEIVSGVVSTHGIKSILLTGNFFDIEEDKTYIALPVHNREIGVWTWQPQYDINCEIRIVCNAFEDQGWYPLPQAAAKGGDVVFQQYAYSYDITDQGWIQERFDLAANLAGYYDYGLFLLQEEIYKPSCMAAWTGVGDPLSGWSIDWEADLAGIHVMSYKPWYIHAYGYWDQAQWDDYAANNRYWEEEVVAWSNYYYDKLVRAWEAHMGNLGKKTCMSYCGFVLGEYYYLGPASDYIIDNYDLLCVYTYPETKEELLNSLPEQYNKRQAIDGKIMRGLTTHWSWRPYFDVINLASLEYYYASALADFIVCYPFIDQSVWDHDYPPLLHSFKTAFDNGVVMTSSSHARGVNFKGDLNIGYGMMKAYVFRKNLQQPPTISSFSYNSKVFEMTVDTLPVMIMSSSLTKPLSVIINGFKINETSRLENVLNYDNCWYFDPTLKQLYISLDPSKPSVPENVPPSTPELFDTGVVDDDGEFLVDWGDSSDPDGFVSYYELQMATDPGFSNVVQTWTPTASHQYVTGLGEGDYYFRVRAVDDDGASSVWSKEEDISVVFPVIPEPADSEGEASLPVFLIIIMLGVGIAFSFTKYFSRIKHNYEINHNLNPEKRSLNSMPMSTEFRDFRDFRDEGHDEERVEILKSLIKFEDDEERVEILKALVKIEEI